MESARGALIGEVLHGENLVLVSKPSVGLWNRLWIWKKLFVGKGAKVNFRKTDLLMSESEKLGWLWEMLMSGGSEKLGCLWVMLMSEGSEKLGCLWVMLISEGSEKLGLMSNSWWVKWRQWKVGLSISNVDEWRQWKVGLSMSNVDEWRQWKERLYMSNVDEWRQWKVELYMSNVDEWRQWKVGLYMSNVDEWRQWKVELYMGNVDEWRQWKVELYMSNVDEWRQRKVGLSMSNIHTSCICDLREKAESVFCGKCGVGGRCAGEGGGGDSNVFERFLLVVIVKIIFVCHLNKKEGCVISEHGKRLYTIRSQCVCIRGCEGGVTARTRFSWVKFRYCDKLLCGKLLPPTADWDFYIRCVLPAIMSGSEV